MSKRNRDETKEFQDNVVSALREIAHDTLAPYDYSDRLDMLVAAVRSIDTDANAYTREFRDLTSAVNSVADALGDINETLKKIKALMKKSDEDN